MSIDTLKFKKCDIISKKLIIQVVFIFQFHRSNSIFGIYVTPIESQKIEIQYSSAGNTTKYPIIRFH